MSYDAGYSDYRFTMHLDWVELRVSLIDRTQSHQLQQALPPPWGQHAFAKAVNGSSSRTDSVFTFRVQDPHSAAQVRRDLDRLQRQYPFAAEPVVTGIEVSFDAHLDGADADLLVMAEHMYRSIADPPSDNRRITGPKGTRGLVESALESRRANMAQLATGQSLVIGNKWDARSVRVYIKDKDGNDRRARAENTLIGDAVPFNTIDGWQQFDFLKLAEHFRWRRSAPAQGLLALLRDWPPALASPPSAKARANHERLTKVGTIADRELSDEARLALRRLTTVQRRPIR